MNDQLSSSDQLISQQQEQSSPLVVPQSQSLLVYILFTLLVVLGVGLVFFVYQNFQLQKSINMLLIEKNKTAETITPSQLPVEVTPTIMPSALPATDSVINWKTYTAKNGEFSLKYPSDWKLTDNSKMVDLYGDGKLQFQADVSITNGSYTLNSINPLAWGPSVCIYSDSQPVDGPSQVFTEYKEINTSTNVYRRSKVDQADPNNPNILTWIICTKGEGSNSFGSVGGFGVTTYKTPLSPDPQTLNVMDEIFTSIVVKNK